MFIRSKLYEFAAIAWQGFKKNGRGFILIRSADSDYFPKQKDTLSLKGSLLKGTTEFEYVPFEALTDLGDVDYIDETTEELVANYDTDWEFVTVIERMDDDGWFNYRFVAPLRPRQAYQQLRHYLQKQPAEVAS